MRADFSTLYEDYPVSNNSLEPLCEIDWDYKADASQAGEICAHRTVKSVHISGEIRYGTRLKGKNF